MNTRTLTRWGPLVAIIIFSLVGGYALENAADNNAQELRDSVVESCNRINVLREEVNAHVEVLTEFLQAAEQARKSAGTTMDLAAADRYSELQGILHKVEVIDCEQEFPSFSLADEL